MRTVLLLPLGRETLGLGGGEHHVRD
eukprot:SAG11_NODE_36876_length_259_cov_0.975000_1_plen_25_part_01